MLLCKQYIEGGEMAHSKIKIWKSILGLWLIILLNILISLSAAPLRIMPLGDSITEGNFAISDYNDVNISPYTSGFIQENDQIAYRGNLWSLLVNAGYNFSKTGTDGDIDFVGNRSKGSNYDTNFDPDHQGVSGITSYEIRNSISSWLDENPADIVLFHIGTNDPGKYIPIGSYSDINQSANTSINNIKATLDTIFSKNSNTKVFLAKIIKNSRAETWGAWLTSDFNNKLEEMVINHVNYDSIKIVDMQNGAGLVYNPAGVDMLPHHADDNLPDYHPDADGFSKIAQTWFDELIASNWIPVPILEINDTYGPELINAGGNDNGVVSTQNWTPFGSNSLVLTRAYLGTNYMYAVARTVDAGIYQSIATVVGKLYEVRAVLLGADSGMNEQFINNSYITISDNIPQIDKSNIIIESDFVTDTTETQVTFRFTAQSTSSYLAIRSDTAWYYGNARAISIKEVLNNDGGTDTTPPVITLNGASTFTFTEGDTFSDPGATAQDNVDGTVTVTSNGIIDMNTAGTYTITYTASDTTGNTATATRTIVVNAINGNDTYGPELINAGGNDNGNINSILWGAFGDTYKSFIDNRYPEGKTYNGEKYLYATPKENGAGRYQALDTEIGQEYEVNAILIGADRNLPDTFLGSSYLSVSHALPTTSNNNLLVQSPQVSGTVEQEVSFRFIATSTISYLTLKSNWRYLYPYARAISVKKILSGK